MDRQQLQELIKSIKSLMRCPSCGASYRASSIQLLEEMDVACLIHLECSQCGMPVLATIIAKTEKIDQSRFITNFGEQEINLPKEEKVSSSSIDVDDVINMHEFLKNFDGDFESIVS